MVLVDSQSRIDPALIFLHIPKAGGSTLHSVIDHQGYPGLSWSGNGSALRLRILDASPDERREVRVLKGHLSFGLHEVLPNGGTYLTMLRDPVERALSFYYYVRANPDHVHHRAVVDGNLSLRECVEQKVSLHGFFDGQTHMLSGWEIPREEFEAHGPEMLDRARHHLAEHFVVAGITERFDETLMLLRRRLNWGMPFYCRENVSRNRPRSPVEPALAQFLRDCSPLDTVLYNHVAATFDAEVRAQPASFAADLTRFLRLNGFYQRTSEPVRGAMRRLARVLNRGRVHARRQRMRSGHGVFAVPI